MDPIDAIGSRREARETALGILYAAEAQSRDLLEVLTDRPVAPARYVVEIVEGVAATMDQLDEMIGHYAEGWRTDPPVSVPVAARQRSAATAAADPPEEPPGVRAVSSLPRRHGLTALP